MRKPDATMLLRRATDARRAWADFVEWKSERKTTPLFEGRVRDCLTDMVVKLVEAHNARTERVSLSLGVDLAVKVVRRGEDLMPFVVAYSKAGCAFASGLGDLVGGDFARSLGIGDGIGYHFLVRRS